MKKILTPPPSLDDSNQSVERQSWQARALDDATRSLLEEDRRYFLGQSLSTPCLNAVRAAHGIYIEDTAGRRYMDFHGNNVHHVGHAHPRVVAAVKAQLDELTFAPRRYANTSANALARALVEIAPAGLTKCLFAPSGNDAMEIALRSRAPGARRAPAAGRTPPGRGAAICARNHSNPHLPKRGDSKTSGNLSVRVVIHRPHLRGFACGMRLLASIVGSFPCAWRAIVRAR